MEYLSQIIKEEELQSIQPGKFNVLKAPRGAGKTTFMFDDRILSFAREKKHIIYLIHNKMSRDSIAEKHNDKACAYDNNFEWLWNRQGWTGENDEDYVHVMCYQTFSALLRKEGTKWLDDIDLIVWDEFDDIRKFFLQEIRRLKKELPNYSAEKITAILEEGNDNSVVSFVYKIKNFILEPKRIILLAISATPELAANLFADYLNYIIKGKIENIYDAKQTIYIEGVAQALLDGRIRADGKHHFWCYTKYIGDILRIEMLAQQAGFNVLSLWAKDNQKYKELWTAEKTEAMTLIQKEGVIPPQYDFVIVNDVIGRAIDIIDTNYQDWVCNSYIYEDIGQFIRARFEPERKYLLECSKEVVQFLQTGTEVASIYYDWHSVSELRELVKEKFIYGKDGRKLTSWNAVRKEYENKIETRLYGKKHERQYRFKSSS